ncbi:unnamed protein product [Polarella glacialis]|uniref:Uncharacterized protein n=1 Tax=Polarella glacialis TaxID=89957 RepID=A0A813K580_POLGL|nr:unnamed protein product [Polarella glacialis]
MLAIKFLVSNGLESVVMGKSATLAGAEGCNGATTEETHPVLILFAVIICGEVWGTTGMLISVPLISREVLIKGLRRSAAATPSTFPKVTLQPPVMWQSWRPSRRCSKVAAAEFRGVCETSEL